MSNISCKRLIIILIDGYKCLLSFFVLSDFDKQDKKGAIAEISELPFGSTSDPVSELNLSTTWPSLAEDVVVDNSVYS
jgi:hypothetical protein